MPDIFEKIYSSPALEHFADISKMINSDKPQTETNKMEDKMKEGIRKGAIINDGEYCSEDCPWLMLLGISPSLPFFQQGAVCCLCHKVLDTDIRTNKFKIASECKALDGKDSQDA